MVMPSTWTDAEILAALDMRDRGMSAAKIGRVLGRSRPAVCGIFLRIDRETKPSRHDGTMPAGWWREGLERQHA